MPAPKLPRMKNAFRWLLVSANWAVTIFLIGVLFIMVNYVSSRRYLRADMTKTKLSQLSEKTIQVLRQLDQPVNIVVFYQPRTPEGANDPLYPLVSDLLREYERQNPNIKIEFVEPYRDRARAEQLAKQFEIDRINLVIFQFGNRHKYLSDTDIAEYDFSALNQTGTPKIAKFRGEDAFTSAIVNITTGEAPLIWFTKGHGEKLLDATDATGLGALKKYLEQQNMAVETVTLAERSEIPSNVKLVAITGPTRVFIDQEIRLLQNYLEAGGRVLALLDPGQDGGLGTLLKQWGVVVDNTVVVDPTHQLPFVSAANVLVTEYTQHPIVEKMQTLVTLYPLACSVRTSHPAAAGVTATALAFTSEAGWGESQTTASTFKFDEGQDIKGPVSVAVASEKQPAQAGAKPSRVVVFGDSDFITDSQLSNVGNRDILLGATYWLIEQEQLIGIGPKEVESIRLNLNKTQLRLMMFFGFLGMPLACGLLGAGVWWQRRS